MYPKAFIEYLYQFHCERDYFECHEILEEHWKEDPPEQRKTIWVGLIQVAVAFYHYRRQNFNGAKRMLNNAIKLIRQNKTEMESLGLEYPLLLSILEEQQLAIDNHNPYVSINLPIKSSDLKEKCLEYAKKKGKVWGVPSDLNNEFLLHKHKKRDRTEVILERKKQLTLRKKAK